ncbi:hypothetical protein ACROYT_G015677 [Oculina patagonica]
MDPQFVSWFTANRQEILNKWKSTFKWGKHNATKSVSIGLPTLQQKRISLQSSLNFDPMECLLVCP